MPPKRWGRPTMMSPAETVKDNLVRYIKKEIEDNNLLGLVGDELDNMTNMLATCGSKKEVFDWCETLMIGETLAAEITKRRVDKGPPFDDMPSAAGDSKKRNNNNNGNGRQVSIANKKGGRRKGTAMSRKNDKNTAAELKPGFFECGCFATTHDLRGNCANCGRIICEQESDEVCYSCGLDPARCVAYEIKVQEGLVSEAALEKNQESYEAAVTKRDELLHYAETRARRTKVIDDQTAVFFSPKDAWMTPAERRKEKDDMNSREVAERNRKIVAMHRAGGAYAVQWEMMEKKGKLRSEMDLKGNDDDSEGDNENEDNDVSSEEDDDDDDCEIAPVEEVRAVPLPSLMQKIWYSLDGSVDSKPSTVNNNNNNNNNTAMFTRKEEEEVPVKKPAIRRIVERSRRVQLDYYEEDAHLFLEAQKAKRDEESQFELDGLKPSDSDNNNYEREEDKKEEKEKEVSMKDSSWNSGNLPDNIIDRFTPSPAMRLNDDGICLSMHQPWAGLLVAGIKTHEGRIWPTDYRGRLWIHAASAQPTDITEVEKHYSKFMPPKKQFPKHYPTRVLIGYVYIVECMDSDTYNEIFKEEQRQVESPFTFICTEAKALPFPLPMNGDHKLFRMDHKVHTAARKQLMEIM